MAGFEVITYGRFWVIAEAVALVYDELDTEGDELPRDVELLCAGSD